MWFLRRDRDNKEDKEETKQADEWVVPDDFTCIQEAIDASCSGDTVVVEPGCYPGAINFMGKDVHLVSSAPENPEVVKATVLDGQGEGPVVQFTSGESSSCLLSGFTITNGHCRASGGVGGGGILVSGGATPVLKNNLITGNCSDLDGGGIAVDEGWPTIVDNRLTGNQASGSGGGVHLSRDAASEERGETVPQSPAESFAGYLDSSTPGEVGMADAASGEGGHSVPAEMAEATSEDGDEDSPSSVLIENNELIDNSAWAGGGLAAADQLAIVKGNTFRENSAHRGGAINLWDNTEVLLVRNNLISNSARDEGGGMMVEWGAAPVIDSNRFAGNDSDRGAAISVAESTAVQLSNNFIQTDGLGEDRVLHIWQQDAVSMHGNRFR